MPERIIFCLRFSAIFTVILFAIQITSIVAFSAENGMPENITVLECEDIKYVGAERIEVHYDRAELKLMGITQDNKQFVISQIKPEKDVVGVVQDGDCDGNTISITEKWAFRSIYITQVYKWNGKKLHQIKTSIHDPSQDSLDTALREALKGNLAKAISELGDVMYPSHYLGCGTIDVFLEKGHRESLLIQKKKGFSRAAIALGNTFELMSEVFSSSDMSVQNNNSSTPKKWLDTFKKCQIPMPRYVAALNDYGYYLQQTGKHIEAVDVLLMVIAENPKRTVAYLNLADVYWSLGKRLEAIDNYKRYEQMMIESEKASRVPARVRERINSNL